VLVQKSTNGRGEAPLASTGIKQQRSAKGSRRRAVCGCVLAAPFDGRAKCEEGRRWCWEREGLVVEKGSIA
jgi:hypothetical protein